MQKDEEGRKKINQWTRYATVFLAAVQAWGFALFTESLQGAMATRDSRFRLQMAFFLTTGAMFVMWLGEQITERGLGNGASLIIFFSIVERIWPGIGTTFRFVTTGAIGTFSLVVLGGDHGRRSWPASSRSRWRRAASSSRSRSARWRGAGCARRRGASSRSASTRRA